MLTSADLARLMMITTLVVVIGLPVLISLRLPELLARHIKLLDPLILILGGVLTLWVLVSIGFVVVALVIK